MKIILEVSKSEYIELQLSARWDIDLIEEILKNELENIKSCRSGHNDFYKTTVVLKVGAK